MNEQPRRPPQPVRRTVSSVSTTTTNLMHLRNPWVIAWWSASFPGFGHLILGQHFKGFLLIIWEIVINVQSRLNTAIEFTFLGQFEQAKAVLDQRWFLLYAPVYIYGIWDSYRSTVSINNIYRLAHFEDARILPFRIGDFGLNYLDKRNPWLAATWTLLMPGLGHLYVYRLVNGFFILVWWIIIAYNSRILEAIHHTMEGRIAEACAVLSVQWYLFMPSIYGFAIYDAYCNAVEMNKLFQQEQAQYLKERYQDPEFSLKVTGHE